MKRAIPRVISRIPKIDETELPALKKRTDFAAAIILILVGILVLRLWYLQIHRGHEYQHLSEKNRIRIQKLAAPRGDIFDRNGDLIITNRPSFNVVWTKEDAPDPKAVISQLSEILNEDRTVLLARVREAIELPRYVPVTLAEDISWQALARIENQRFRLPGIRIEAIPARKYLYGDAASHLIGYLGQINQKELKEKKEIGYQSGDQLGKMGIEKVYEPYLRGKKGEKYLEVDSHGFEQKLLQLKESTVGNDIQLTLDINLQKAAEEALTDKAGAVVVMEVKTGRLLAMASAPLLPLTRFTGGISQKTWDEVINNPKNPLINKTIQGHYPPGSTYKIITAMAALSEKVVSPDTIFYCSGSLKFGNRRYGCWKRSGHGAVNLRRALKESCDVYFYQVSQKLGVDTLAKYARSFGLGEKTGISLENEKSGLVPTKEWKLRRKKRAWQEGETLSVAIGQGFNLTTPLQICRMTAATVNGGNVMLPQFIERIISSEGDISKQFKPKITGKVLGSPAFLRLIRKALVAAVNEPHGTGGKAKLKTITVGGKTGTAQVIRLNRHKSELEDEIPYKFRDHAWFTCFAPAENPEIAITVLIEHGGHGGGAAGPVAKKVLMRYFNIQEKKD